VSKNINIIRILEAIGVESGDVLVTDIARFMDFDIGHPASVRRALRRLKKLGIVKSRKWHEHPTGRPNLRWSLTTSGVEFLEFLGICNEKRYKVTWHNISAYIALKTGLSRIGKNPGVLRPKPRKRLSNWW